MPLFFSHSRALDRSPLATQPLEMGRKSSRCATCCSRSLNVGYPSRSSGRRRRARLGAGLTVLLLTSSRRRRHRWPYKARPSPTGNTAPLQHAARALAEPRTAAHGSHLGSAPTPTPPYSPTVPAPPLPQPRLRIPGFRVGRNVSQLQQHPQAPDHLTYAVGAAFFRSLLLGVARWTVSPLAIPTHSLLPATLSSAQHAGMDVYVCFIVERRRRVPRHETGVHMELKSRRSKPENRLSRCLPASPPLATRCRPVATESLSLPVAGSRGGPAGAGADWSPANQRAAHAPRAPVVRHVRRLVPAHRGELAVLRRIARTHRHQFQAGADRRSAPRAVNQQLKRNTRT